MKFRNESPWDAELFRSELPSGRMMASLLVRLAYAVDDEGRLRLLAPDDPGGAWAAIRRDQVPTPHGELAPDLVWPRTATDLIVLGDAVADAPATQVRVELEAGPYRQSVIVHGDRRWESNLAGGLRAGAAEPFTRMPLSWQTAFGGAAKGPYGPIPCAANPSGRGYYLGADEALGQPLANVEWADAPTSGSVEQAAPDPAIVGPYPSSWWLRLSKVWTAAPERYAVDLHPEAGLFDQAHPRLSGQWIRAGDRLAIRGMGPPLRAIVPACPAAAEFILGDARCPRALELEELLVDAERRVLALAWRKCVQYEYVRHQERITVLREAAA